MVNVKLNLSKFGKIKLGLHSVQALLTFIAICMFIAMATKEGKSDGRNFYYVALCFASIIPLVYLIGVPMWARTQRFANLWAFLALDILFTIFWLAAWASVLSWVREGQAAGFDELKDDEKKDKSKGCDTFKLDGYGTPAKCSLASSLAGIGGFIFVFWIGSAAISFLYFRDVRNSNATEPWLGDSRSTDYTPGDAESGKLHGDGNGGDDAAGGGAWSTDPFDDAAHTGYTSQHNLPAHGSHGGRPGSGASDHGDEDYEMANAAPHRHSVYGAAPPPGSSVATGGAAGAAGAGGLNDSQYHDAHPGRPWEESSYGRPGRADDPFADSAYHGSTAGAGGENRDDRVNFPSAPYGYDRQGH